PEQRHVHGGGVAGEAALRKSDRARSRLRVRLRGSGGVLLFGVPIPLDRVSRSCGGKNLRVEPESCRTGSTRQPDAYRACMELLAWEGRSGARPNTGRAGSGTKPERLQQLLCRRVAFGMFWRSGTCSRMLQRGIAA